MTFVIGQGPRRIVCLSDEATEVLYALGEEARIVGISAYTVRPPAARRDKPLVTGFQKGSVAKIRALNPDLVIGFSDVQAKLAAELIAAGLQVLIFNQRSVQEILDAIVSLGQLVGAGARARDLTQGYARHLDGVAREAARLPRRPRVYFEEWCDPLITGIRWVHELIELAGGDDVFAHLADQPASKDRVVRPEAVVEGAPEVVFASWCGKPFDPGSFSSRPGFADLPAVRNGRLIQVPGEIILQPGPAALTDGARLLASHIAAAATSTPAH